MPLEGSRKGTVPRSPSMQSNIKEETLTIHRGGVLMETKLERISQLSWEKPDMVFTSIGHLINREMLKKCHEEMDKDKAVGIDGVTKEEYGKKLDENLEDLVERLKRKSYRPHPARRVEIPKDNGKTRPLSIYCYEDKLVQASLKKILEAVYEPVFYDEMMGFRAGKKLPPGAQKAKPDDRRKQNELCIRCRYKRILQPSEP